VRARFVIPARFVRAAKVAAPAAQPQGEHKPRDRTALGNVLILEDNLIIAMDAEAIVERFGAKNINVASNVREAMIMIEKKPPDFALLDINLGNENSLPVAMKLKELGIAFAFATGYGERAPLPPELMDTPIVQKPYTPEALSAAIPVKQKL
jgi:two-component SAPR family response regulator